MRRNPVHWIAYLLLSFTGSGIAWADESQEAYVPQDTGVRGGTVVGYSSFNGDEYLTLGAAFAVGHRFGRITIEAEYDYLTLQSGGDQSVVLGTAHRLGVNARVDILRVGRRFVGKNSRVVLWGELGVGRQYTDWAAGAVDPTLSRPDRDALSRQIGAMDQAPPRPDAAVGFGWLLDHRFDQPRGFPARVGWQFGWRITGAEQLASITPVLACTDDCMSPESPADVSLLVSSSLLFSW
jgi:hypothetical protein